MLRRLTIAVIVVLTVGVMLMTFPSVRGIGAGVLTSRRCGRCGRRAGRAEPARQRLRRPPARLQRRGTARRRGRRRGGVGPDRGADPQLRGGADLGRPAADPAHLVLHQQAVPELDPDRGGGARHRRVRRRLGGAGADDAGGAAPAGRGHRAVGRPGLRPPGHRRHRRDGAGARAGQRRRRGQPVGPALPGPGAPGRPGSGTTARPRMPRMRTELGDATSNLPWQWVQPRRPARRRPTPRRPTTPGSSAAATTATPAAKPSSAPTMPRRPHRRRPRPPPAGCPADPVVGVRAVRRPSPSAPAGTSADRPRRRRGVVASLRRRRGAGAWLSRFWRVAGRLRPDVRASDARSVDWSLAQD